jgi:hypothetical protein
MAQPEFVPTPALTTPSYSSPLRRDGSWMADRPGELVGRQPTGDRLGNPGPDQGYADVLCDTIRGTLTLADGEHESDALAAVKGVALKRASLFGRAPVVHDITSAVAALGLKSAVPTGDAGERRRLLLEEAHHPHCYDKLRAIVDGVDEEALNRPVDQIVATGTVIDW